MDSASNVAIEDRAAGSSSHAELEAALRSFAAGLGLAALYGAALGARFGPVAMLMHGAGVPAAILALGLFGTPAFYILLAHAGVVFEPDALAGLVLRALSTSGQVLGGLAPAAALLAVSAETRAGAALFAAVGLSAAFLLGMRRLFGELEGRLRMLNQRHALGARCIAWGFYAFAATLLARMWWATLDVLSGAAP
jgi:hypothetical protein